MKLTHQSPDGICLLCIALHVTRFIRYLYMRITFVVYALRVTGREKCLYVPHPITMRCPYILKFPNFHHIT